jgi:hypothetical protein
VLVSVIRVIDRGMHMQLGRLRVHQREAGHQRDRE